MVDFSKILGNSPYYGTSGSSGTSGNSDSSSSNSNSESDPSKDILQSFYNKAETIASSTTNTTHSGLRLTLKGSTHYKVVENSEAWDYDCTNSVWASFENGEKLSLNTTDKSCTVEKGAKTTIYAPDLSTVLSTNIDNNRNEYNVAVIDDFDTPDIGGTDISHGEIVRALINSNNPNACSLNNHLNYDAYDENEGGLSLTKVSNYLTEIDKQIKNGKDIDAINLSMGVSFVLSEVGLKSLDDLKTAAGRQQALSSLSTNNPDLVTLINQISNMSDEGINFYISAGNDYGDSYGSDAGADENADGIPDTDETKGQLGVFNALSLATGTSTKSNVHTIAATATYKSENGTLVNDTTNTGYAWYSDRGGDVETKIDGDVLLKNLGQSTNGLYKYDINGDGKVDFYSQYDDTPSDTADEYQDPETGMYEFDTDNDGYIDVYTTDINGSNQLIQGTSFAAPRAAKEKFA